MVMASRMKLGQGQRGSVQRRAVMRFMYIVVVVVVALGMFGKCTVNAARDQDGHERVQTTHKSSAKSLAFGQQSLFQCPCSYQYCDGYTYSTCSCNLYACSCSCHNSAQTKVPGGATIQLLPKP